MTWGIFELGMHRTEAFMWLSVGVFCATVVGVTIMLITGHWANNLFALNAFLDGKISEKKAK